MIGKWNLCTRVKTRLGDSHKCKEHLKFLIQKVSNNFIWITILSMIKGENTILQCNKTRHFNSNYKMCIVLNSLVMLRNHPNILIQVIELLKYMLLILCLNLFWKWRLWLRWKNPKNTSFIENWIWFFLIGDKV